MSLTVSPVPRNLATRVTFLFLEFDDLFAILVLAVVMNMLGRFLHREMFGIHRTISARYWFYGADYSFDAQLAYLSRVAKLSEDSLRSLIGKIGDSAVAENKPPTRRDGVPHLEVRVEFRILDHVEVRRKVGRNWITRCPSCAAAGHDTSKDNLAISVEEPQKYIC